MNPPSGPDPDAVSGHLLRARDGSVVAHCSDEDGHCITCSDEAIPMRVVRTDAGMGSAWCTAVGDLSGDETEVMTLLVDPVEPGETLLVHAGAALARAAFGELQSATPAQSQRSHP